MLPFSYEQASSLADAVRRIASLGNGSRILAGGTTLYDLMKLDIERPAVVVDINQLPGLSGIEIDEQEIKLGALVRMSDLAAHPAVVRDYPAISESLWRAASQQLRNMASLGGNLLQRTRCPYFRGGEPYPCNKRNPGSGCSAIGGEDRGLAMFGGSDQCIAVYPSDWAIALVAFDAQLDVVGPKGRRSFAVEDLHREPGSTPHIETNLASGELIERIRIPTTRLGKGSTYLKIRDRESYAFALTSAAVAVAVEDGRVADARIALGGVATRPWRARAAEQALVGKQLTREAALAAGTIAFQGADSGHQNGFRIELGRNTVANALMTAVERA